MEYLDTPIGKFWTLLLIKDMKFALDQLLKTALKVETYAWAEAIERAGTNRPCDLATSLINQAEGWVRDREREGVK